jgi:integrase/recombinase XerC
LNSFYDWAMEEGLRPHNPARAIRRARKRPTSVYRLTKDEMLAMWRAARTTREQRVIGLGFGAGLRNAELRGLQGRHFERQGWIMVSADIAKGGSGRPIPVIAEVLGIIEDIRATVGYDEYVLPAQRWRDPSRNRERIDLKLVPSSSQALRTLVAEVAKRAGIKAHIHPHLMRHAFGDHVARDRGLKVAQALLGHKDSKTTEAYTGGTTLDELSAAMAGFSFLDEDDMAGYHPPDHPANPHKATTGIEPVNAERRFVERYDENRGDAGW